MRPGRAWALCALLYGGCGSDPSHQDDSSLYFSGGSTTVFDDSRDAYAQAVPALMGDREDDFFVGNSIFNRAWVVAVASVPSIDGLGPLYNATNCSACHFKDGRGHPPLKDGDPFVSMLFRISIPGADVHGEPLGDANYGNQIQDNGILGVMPEALPHVTYAEIPGTFADGTPYSLRMPSYSLLQPAYGPLPDNLLISPRVAQGVFGLGLLEALDEQTILKRADPDDADHDGISGRPNRVWNYSTQRVELGRFGWKANQPTLEQQTLAAFQGDIGITSKLFPGQNCSATETVCATNLSGEDPATPGAGELGPVQQQAVVSYVHTLAVPARRDVEMPLVKRGARVFAKAGCEGCHLPELKTGDLANFPELSQQVIRPYTDMLLHDMGPELADNRPDFEATGTEWRTAPLWGVGMLQRVNQHNLLMHDGRARGVLEAIMFHGGEATASREKVRALSKDDREALVAFLESL